MPRMTKKELTQFYERKVFDLEQLLEITKSLNSTIDFHKLIDSILMTCMAHLRVGRAGIFLRRTMDSEELVLNRHFQGLELDEKIQYVIPDYDPLFTILKESSRPLTMEEIEPYLTRPKTRDMLHHLEPALLVPLIVKDQLQGLILLAEPLLEGNYSQQEKDFLKHIALSAAIAIHNAYLFEMTSTDLLTKLKMRHYTITRLREEVATNQQTGRPLSIIMADIDHFKLVNDHYGHSAGDEVLQNIAKRILDHIRPEDVAGRYGGEEFLLVLPNTDCHAAKHIAQRIRKAVEKQPIAFQDKQIKVTLSLGITEYNSRGDTDLRLLIDRADHALYKSKDEGRNRVSLSL